MNHPVTIASLPNQPIRSLAHDLTLQELRNIHGQAYSFVENELLPVDEEKQFYEGGNAEAGVRRVSFSSDDEIADLPPSDNAVFRRA